MEYQRKKGREAEQNAEPEIQARTTQSSYRSYSGYQSPLERKPSSPALPILVGTATLLPIAALVYYFAISDSRHPIVEREDSSISDVISADNSNPSAGRNEPNGLAQNTDLAHSPPTALEIARDKMISDQVRALQEELAKQDIQNAKAEAAARAGEDWKVEGFDAAAQETLAKNTAFWNQMAQRDLDKEEIALARRRGGTFSGTAGDLYDGKPQHAAQARQANGPSRTSMAMSAGLTSLLTRGPASASGPRSCSPMRPRSPDPQCHANYPCRICGGCCCRCEAVLAGFIKLGA